MTSAALIQLATSISIPDIEKYTHVAISIYPLTFVPPYQQKVELFSEARVTVVIGYGNLSIPVPISHGPIQVFNNSNLSITVSLPNGEIDFSNIGYAIAFAPFNQGNAEPWDRIRSCMAVISLLEQNRVFQKCIDRYIVDQRSGQWSQIGPEDLMPIPPILYKSPDSTFEALKNIQNKDFMSSHVGFSLDWFYRSLKNEDEVFAFLAAWIACESITNSKDTDVSKIVTVLWQQLRNLPGYESKNKHDIKELLLLGKLHGVRGRLAHRGVTKGITPLIKIYVQILYAEMFFAQFCQPSPQILFPFLNPKREELWNSIKESEHASP